ncbi:DUF421 domain-containing protein [Bacillaceae bacterium W0354]
MDIVYHFILTPLAVFVVGYILLRIMGKKAVAEMSSFDLLVILILGTVISEPIVTKRLEIALYYAIIISIIYLIFSYLSINNKFKKVLTSSPTVLVRNGDIDERGLRKVKLNTEELLGELRVKGYTNISDLAVVIMEETGQISAIPKADKRPVQPSDLNMAPSPTFIPIPIIINGELIEHNLKYVKKDKNWLTAQLQSYNLSLEEMDKISLATFNQQGYLDLDTIDRKDQDSGVYSYKPGDHN